MANSNRRASSAEPRKAAKNSVSASQTVRVTDVWLYESEDQKTPHTVVLEMSDGSISIGDFPADWG